MNANIDHREASFLSQIVQTKVSSYLWLFLFILTFSKQKCSITQQITKRFEPGICRAHKFNHSCFLSPPSLSRFVHSFFLTASPLFLTLIYFSLSLSFILSNFFLSHVLIPAITATSCDCTKIRTISRTQPFIKLDFLLPYLALTLVCR